MDEQFFAGVEALTFDCYGTLIDWERGILEALRPVLERHGIGAADDELLEAYARHEATLEAGPYLRYRDVLARSLQGVCDTYGVTPSAGECRRFADSVSEWPAFDDSTAALTRLATRFELGVITNCDDDLFARSAARLRVGFDWVVTAEQARSYKPSLAAFEHALAAIDVPRERIVHVAQSLYHDHVPAKRLGLATAWVDRRRGTDGFGATPPATATPDLVVPDMKTLADVALA